MKHLYTNFGKFTNEAMDFDGNEKRIKVTYQAPTPNDELGEGEYEDEHGWEDEDGRVVDSVEEAIDFIKSMGSVEASSSNFKEDVYYTTLDPVQDRDFFVKGIRKFFGLHPEGFTLEEQEELFNALK